MKNYGRIIAAVVIGLLLGFACAACDGRVSGIWFSLETASMLVFTLVYFLAEGESGNTLLSCLTSLILTFLPVLIWTAVLRSGNYFGYSSGKIIMGSTVCGIIIFLCVALSRHEVGPLRAAFGRNMLPAFFAVAGVHRLIKYFKDLDSFTISFKDDLCVHGFLFVFFAVGMMIGANRSKLAKLETYIAVAVWAGAFTALHIIDAVTVPVLDLRA